MQAFLTKQQGELAAFLTKSINIQVEERLAELRRLPLWGEQVAIGDINFGWPSKETFRSWPAGVSLKSITFSTCAQEHYGVVSSVQCKLSNNESSPLFDTAGVGQFHQKTIKFEANRPVKSV